MVICLSGGNCAGSSSGLGIVSRYSCSSSCKFAILSSSGEETECSDLVAAKFTLASSQRSVTQTIKPSSPFLIACLA